MNDRKAGPKVSSDTGKLPGVSMLGKSALTAALASGRIKLGTIRYSNGWRIRGVTANAAKSSAYIDHASLHFGTGSGRTLTSQSCPWRPGTISNGTALSIGEGRKRDASARRRPPKRVAFLTCELIGTR